jgi:hypothetical protein
MCGGGINVVRIRPIPAAHMRAVDAIHGTRHIDRHLPKMGYAVRSIMWGENPHPHIIILI